MLQTVEGIDHSGPIELTQQPQNVSDRTINRVSNSIHSCSIVFQG